MAGVAGMPSAELLDAKLSMKGENYNLSQDGNLSPMYSFVLLCADGNR
jgi:hypothetical protein